jgi:lysophospholipase L1-like esterase
MSCLIAGDSIAVGIAQHRPECAMNATVGITSRAFNSHVGAIDADTVVISLGSNDSADPSAELSRLRAKVRARRVIWIVPAYRNSDAIRRLARSHQDSILEIPSLTSDHIHPTPSAYRALAGQTL